MDSFDWLYILLISALLLLSAIFSAAEIGILSINRFRLHQLADDGSRPAATLTSLLEHPARLLTTILVLITVINYSNESLVTYWLNEVHGLPEWIPFFGLLLLVLIFAEITPITYAAANPEVVGLRVAPLTALATRVMRPLVAAIAWIASGLVRIFGGEPRRKPLVTGEEVLTIVDMEAERGALEEEAKELIHSIFEFSDTVVREVMVPRTDVEAVREDMTVGQVIAQIMDHHYSRLPVYEDDIDHITGIVHVKDLLPFQMRQETDHPIKDALRPVTYVPETKKVTELLRELRESKQTLAIVLDEYGGTAGLVTIEDLLEEIVGEINDEYDVEQRMMEWVDEKELLVDGRVSIDEASDELKRELPRGDYDTIGGLLFSEFGDVPAPGESIEIDNLVFVVEELDGHRIAKVRIIVPETPPAEEEE